MIVCESAPGFDRNQTPVKTMFSTAHLWCRCIQGAVEKFVCRFLRLCVGKHNAADKREHRAEL